MDKKKPSSSDYSSIEKLNKLKKSPKILNFVKIAMKKEETDNFYNHCLVNSETIFKWKVIHERMVEIAEFGGIDWLPLRVRHYRSLGLAG